MVGIMYAGGVRGGAARRLPPRFADQTVRLRVKAAAWAFRLGWFEGKYMQVRALIAAGACVGLLSSSAMAAVLPAPANIVAFQPSASMAGARLGHTTSEKKSNIAGAGAVIAIAAAAAAGLGVAAGVGAFDHNHHDNSVSP